MQSLHLDSIDISAFFKGFSSKGATLRAFGAAKINN
jgi:hypothetical protein